MTSLELMFTPQDNEIPPQKDWSNRCGLYYYYSGSISHHVKFYRVFVYVEDIQPGGLSN